MDEITTSRLTIEIGASSDNARREISKVTDALARLRGNTNHKVKVDTKEVDSAHKKVGKLANALNSLKRVAFYRAIRSVIKSFTDAFAVGVENAYWYSKTVGGEVGYVAEAFDRLSSAGFKADNQLGAALASLKASVVPILIEIIRWVTIAADKLTQLFAILGGHTTYLKAVDYTKEAYENTAAGAAAAKEWKNQLMGFDEINRLEEPSSGGGGGGGAIPDYENMFEEAAVEDWALRFKAIWDEKIYPTLVKIYNFIKEKIWPVLKDVLEYVVENIDWILPLALDVGVALLGWKIGSKLVSGLSSVFNLLGNINTKAGLVTTALAGLTVSGVSFADAWNNGVDWKNTAGYIGGATMATTSLVGVFGSLASAIAVPVFGYGALIQGFRDWRKEGELSMPTFTLLEGGFASLSMIFGTIPTLIAMGVVAYDKFIGKTSSVVPFIDNVAEKFGNAAKSAAGFGKETSAAAGTINNAAPFFSRIGDMLGVATEATEGFSGAIAALAYDIRIKLAEMSYGFSDLAVQIKQAFGIQWEIPAPKVPHISIVPEQVFGDLRTMFGINAIPRFHVEMFATGGFPEDGLFMANHGELVGKFSNGKTAVANNEQITEGISRAVYEAFVDAMTQTGGESGDKEVRIYLDGKQIAETTTKYQRQFARAAG